MGKKIVNHVIYLLDVSGSMRGIIGHAKQVLVNSLSSMQSISERHGQETLVSLYTFNHTASQLFNDQAIANINLSNINFSADGGTALIDAALKAILDGIQNQISSKNDNEDHSYLLNVITDGYDEHSKYKADDLKKVISKLNDEWTVAIQVPDANSIFSSKSAGFPAGNISVWDRTSKKGLEESVDTFTTSFHNYAAARSVGQKSSTTYYAKTDLSNVSRSQVQANLDQVSGRLYHCQRGPVQIRDFVEAQTGGVYRAGTAYYELTKPELVHESKNVVIVHKKDGRKYGGKNARKFLGIPENQRIKVTPGDHGDWRIFIQSTSVNRSIHKNTSVFVEG